MNEAEVAPDICHAIDARQREIVHDVSDLSGHDLHESSNLEGWSRLSILCHLRYGADALVRMTDDTVQGRPTLFYPEGRNTQRPSTLTLRPGESLRGLLRSLGESGERLHDRWSAVAAPQWALVVPEPAGDEDLGGLTLAQLALNRLTELEVHGEDLDLGLRDWSRTFVAVALPSRLRRLEVRRTNHLAYDDSLSGSWQLRGDRGWSWTVSVTARGVTSQPTSGDEAPARVIVEGSSRDVLAMLLGRTTKETLRTSGDHEFASAFKRAFPGP